MGVPAFGTCTIAIALFAGGCSVYYLPQEDRDALPSGTGAIGSTTTAGTAGAEGASIATSATGSGGSTGGALGTGSSGPGGVGEDAAAGAGGADLDASNGAGGGGGGGAGGAGGTAIVPVDAGIVTVDDSAIGIGVDQINYVGSWQHCKPCTSTSKPPLYMVSNSWVASEDAAGTNSFSFAFSGTAVVLYGVVDPRHGMGAVSVDEGAETTIDFYNQVRQGDHAVWSSPDLPGGTHILRFRLTGTKSAISAGAGLAIDRIDVRQ